jgi:hypothetical protein
MTITIKELPELVAKLHRRKRIPSGDPEMGPWTGGYINPDGPEAADTLESLAAEVERLTEENRRLESRLCETQMLLVSCGDHDALAEKAKTWPEAKRAFADRCLKCGGLHGASSGCMGPPLPSVPHPHAGKMQG